MSDAKKKVGRPAKGDFPNNVKLTIKVSEPLNDRLEAYCKKHSLTKPEAVRLALENLTK